MVDYAKNVRRFGELLTGRIRTAAGSADELADINARLARVTNQLNDSKPLAQALAREIRDPVFAKHLNESIVDLANRADMPEIKNYGDLIDLVQDQSRLDRFMANLERPNPDVLASIDANGVKPPGATPKAPDLADPVVTRVSDNPDTIARVGPAADTSASPQVSRATGTDGAPSTTDTPTVRTSETAPTPAAPASTNPSSAAVLDQPTAPSTPSGTIYGPDFQTVFTASVRLDDAHIISTSADAPGVLRASPEPLGPPAPARAVSETPTPSTARATTNALDDATEAAIRDADSLASAAEKTNVDFGGFRNHLDEIVLNSHPGAERLEGADDIMEALSSRENQHMFNSMIRATNFNGVKNIDELDALRTTNPEQFSRFMDDFAALDRSALRTSMARHGNFDRLGTALERAQESAGLSKKASRRLTQLSDGPRSRRMFVGRADRDASEVVGRIFGEEGVGRGYRSIAREVIKAVKDPDIKSFNDLREARRSDPEAYNKFFERLSRTSEGDLTRAFKRGANPGAHDRIANTFQRVAGLVGAPVRMITSNNVSIFGKLKRVSTALIAGVAGLIAADNVLPGQPISSGATSAANSDIPGLSHAGKASLTGLTWAWEGVDWVKKGIGNSTANVAIKTLEHKGTLDPESPDYEDRVNMIKIACQTLVGSKTEAINLATGLKLSPNDVRIAVENAQAAHPGTDQEALAAQSELVMNSLSQTIADRRQAHLDERADESLGRVLTGERDPNAGLDDILNGTSTPPNVQAVFTQASAYRTRLTALANDSFDPSTLSSNALSETFEAVQVGLNNGIVPDSQMGFGQFLSYTMGGWRNPQGSLTEQFNLNADYAKYIAQNPIAGIFAGVMGWMGIGPDVQDIRREMLANLSENQGQVQALISNLPNDATRLTSIDPNDVPGPYHINDYRDTGPSSPALPGPMMNA